MEDIDAVDAAWAAAAIDGLLVALGTELEAAYEAVADTKAEERMGEILQRCIKAASLAMASQTIRNQLART